MLLGLMPDDAVNMAITPGTKIWFSYSLSMPLAFHALVYARSVPRNLLHHSKIFPNSPSALAIKLQVIQKLKDVVSDSKGFAGDEAILAILILASHEVMDPSDCDGKSSPFNSPLGSA